MLKSRTAFLLIAIFAANVACWGALASRTAVAADDRAPIPDGSGVFEFPLIRPNGTAMMRVWYYRPMDFPRNGRVLFVMHGVKRNADEYRDNWIRIAERDGVFIIAPEFSLDLFPSDHAYQLGNVIDEKGAERPRDQWSFLLIDRIFDDVVARNRLTTKRYSIFGHSAGGQFVHRLMIFCAPSRVEFAIAANAGWYTMLTRQVEFPYGLKGTVVDKPQESAALSCPLVVLLGGADTDSKHRYLRRSAEANAQGPHRLARGQAFYKIAEDAADQLGVPIRWQIVVVPGVDHDNAKMAAAAGELLNRSRD